MQIRQMTLKELYEAYPLVVQLYTELSYEEFEDLVYEMRHVEYQMFGLFERGELICFAGVCITTSLAHKRHLGVFDFVTDEPWRFMGYAKKMLSFLEDYAKSAMCGAIVVCVEDLQEDALHFCAKAGLVKQCSRFVKRLS